MVNRIDHAQSGAVMALRILDNMGADAEDIATIITAIGNHDEGTAFPVNAVAAAIILADKTDVRRSRVRNQDFATFDIHYRVNYAAQTSRTYITEDKKEILLEIDLDTEISSVMDYFEIFMERMLLPPRRRKAGAALRPGHQRPAGAVKNLELPFACCAGVPGRNMHGN